MQNADRTSSEMPGKKMRTRWMASARVSPEKPGAMASSSQGVASTPMSANRPVTSVSRPATAPATLRAWSSSPFARSVA